MSVLIHIRDLQDQRIGEFRLDQSLTLGKSTDCDIVLESPYISAEHARFETEGPQVYVHSKGLNGVMVNDQDVARGQRMELHSEDIISLPGFVLHITGLRPTKQAIFVVPMSKPTTISGASIIYFFIFLNIQFDRYT